jgi:hypothetical protein
MSSVASSLSNSRVVLHEKDRRQRKVGAIDRDDCGPAARFRTVSLSLRGRSPIGQTTWRSTASGLKELPANRGQKIPVNMIAVGDDRIGLKAEECASGCA